MDEIKQAGGDALAVGGDVAADDFPEKVISATIKYVSLPLLRPLLRPAREGLLTDGAPCRKYGKINHIVNNAGFTYDRMLHTTPDDAFDIIIRVHVRAPFRLIRAAAPHMRIKVRPVPIASLRL